MASVTIDLAAMQRLADDAAEKGILHAAARGEQITKVNLSRPGTGRIYKRGARRTHQASAPGQPPAVDTGNLRNKTAADTQVRRDGDALVGRIVQNSEQAHALAVGTERMAARPSLQLLATDHQEELRNAFVAGASQ